MENIGHTLIVDYSERFNSKLKNFVNGPPFNGFFNYSPRYSHIKSR